MNKKFTDKIKAELEDYGYEYAIAVATCAEIEAGAACGQLSIITEEDNDSKEKR
jgi:hypothetical protein